MLYSNSQLAKSPFGELQLATRELATFLATRKNFLRAILCTIFCKSKAVTLDSRRHERWTPDARCSHNKTDKSGAAV